jgi:hypothetical protein
MYYFMSHAYNIVDINDTTIQINNVFIFEHKMSEIMIIEKIESRLHLWTFKMPIL